jgi:DNA-binding SARP family transcriptional activator/class 3 adenylate cyclase
MTRQIGAMEFRMLGPLELVRRGGSVPLPRAKQRRLLAMLLIDANRTVPVDRLIDGLWDDNAPPTAVKTLQTYVSQLRTMLEPDRRQGGLGGILVTGPSGYELRVDRGDVDAGRFEELLAEGRDRLAADPAEARRLLAGALRLWRGGALAEFAGEPFAEGEIARLEELRLVAVEERIQADLALGRHDAVVGELRELLRDQPLGERRWAQLMLALYRSGRQADALHAYQDARRTLAEQLGIDPGPALRRLEEQILRQDAALEWRPAPGPKEVRPVARGRSVAAFKNERRWATVLIAGIGGPDLESSGVGPSRVGRGFLGQVAGEVRRHGGQVIASTGSSVTALFGAPVAHEDDAERAVRAGLAIRELAASLRLPSEEIPVWVAIDTGELHTEAGPIEGDGPGACTISGAAPEAARRLAGQARAGDVVVGASTRQAAGRSIRYQPMEPSDATDGVPWWRVVGAGEPTERPLSGTPMVGRRTELRLLHTVWERTVRERRSHLVTVLGPPGIGKSRLCHEFLTEVEEEPALVLRGRSFPYGDGTYGAIAQMVRRAIGAGELESPGQIRRRLEPWLETFLPAEERGRAGEHLITLLSLIADIALPEQRRVIHESVRRFFEAVAANQPTVLVIEDVHWASGALLDLLEEMAGRTRALPLLMVAVARPELLDDRPGWAGGLPAYTALPLDALSPPEVRELAGLLVQAAADDHAMMDTIERAAGGNPLFVEELVAWIAEGRHRAEQVPGTVRAVIAARLDQLPPAERAVTVDASVMGDRFWRSGLERLGTLPAAQLDEALESLELRGVVLPSLRSSVPGERELAFRHELFAEVAYGTLPDPVRVAKHLQVARHLEQAGGGSVPPAVLARHWREAGDLERAATCLIDAGDQANHGWERARAVALYDPALELLAGRDPRRWRRVNLKRAVALQAWAHSVLDVGHLRVDRMDEAAGAVRPGSRPG